MTEPTAIVPDCMSDQGKRYSLLDQLVSLYDDVADLCVLLLTLEHGGLEGDEYLETIDGVYTIAGDVVIDLINVGPLVTQLSKGSHA